MALRAKGNEVIRCVGPTMGAEDLVVYMKIASSATVLTAPPIALEHRAT